MRIVSAAVIRQLPMSNVMKPLNRLKSYPGPKKRVPGGYFFAIFDASLHVMRFSAYLEAKNDEKLMFFLVGAFDVVLFFPTWQPLILLTGAALQRFFRVYEKHVFSQKMLKKRVANRSLKNLLKNELRGPLLGPKIDENRARNTLKSDENLQNSCF